MKKSDFLYSGLVVLLVLILTVSCSKDEDPIVSPPEVPTEEPADDLTVSFSYADNMESVILTSTSTFTISEYQWTVQPSGSSVTLSNPAASVTELSLPASATTVNVSLTVKSGAKTYTGTQSIGLPAYALHRQYGLGKNLTAERSNNAPREWYIDQFTTGASWNSNCGPACVTMTMQWSDPSFTKTAEDARNTYPLGGGWWYTNNIIDYLNAHSIPNNTFPLNQDALKAQLDGGNVAILCLDAYYIRAASGKDSWRKDKFYTTASTGWGHFIVAKGYKVVDGVTMFEIYDPWSLDVSYEDGTLKGKDRYYRGEDIITAAVTTNWWRYMIVVNKLSGTGSAAEAKAALAGALDPATIPHQRGR